MAHPSTQRRLRLPKVATLADIAPAANMHPLQAQAFNLMIEMYHVGKLTDALPRGAVHTLAKRFSMSGRAQQCFVHLYKYKHETGQGAQGTMPVVLELLRAEAKETYPDKFMEMADLMALVKKLRDA